MSVDCHHVADRPEAGLVGGGPLAGAVDVDGRPVGVDGQDGVDPGGEELRRTDAPVFLGEVEDDGGLGPLGEPAEPVDDPAGLGGRGGGLGQDQATGRDDDQGGGEVVEELTLPGLPAAGSRRGRSRRRGGRRPG
jgi:hypothetical protein